MFPNLGRRRLSLRKHFLLESSAGSFGADLKLKAVWALNSTQRCKPADAHPVPLGNSFYSAYKYACNHRYVSWTVVQVGTASLWLS